MGNRRHQNHKRGGNHHAAVLTAAEVSRMRALKEDYDLCVKCISKLFDVSYPTAWDAINYKTWKHVKD